MNNWIDGSIMLLLCALVLVVLYLAPALDAGIIEWRGL